MDSFSRTYRDDVDAERAPYGKGRYVVVRNAGTAGCILAMYGACVVTAVRISGGSIEMRCENQAGSRLFCGCDESHY